MDEKNEDGEKNNQKKSTSKWSNMESSSDEGEDDGRDDEGSFMNPEASASSGNEASRDKPQMSSLEKLALKQERERGGGRDNRNTNNRQNIPSNEGINGSGTVFRGKGNPRMKQEDEYTAGGRNRGNNAGNSREKDWGGGGVRGSSGDARNAPRVAREERRDKDRAVGPNRGPALNTPPQAALSDEKRSDGAKVSY